MKKISQAVILAGGRGMRLRPLTSSIPKPMIFIDNKPFIDFIIRDLNKNNINNILILTGYKSKVFEKFFSSKVNKSVNIFRGKIRYLTATRLIKAHHLLEKHFYLLYADNYWELEKKKMEIQYFKKKPKLQMTVFTNSNGTGEYGFKNNIKYDKLELKKYTSNPSTLNYNAINIGYYIINKKIVPKLVRKNAMFEDLILPNLIKNKEATVYKTKKQYYYITNKKALNNFKKVSKKLI